MTITAKIEGISPMCFGRFHNTPKLTKEAHDDYEKRTWREKLHSDAEGFVYATPMMFKNCIAAAAKYLSVHIPGKGKATYTKHFEAGVLVNDTVYILKDGEKIKKDDVEGYWMLVPADGRRGGTKRVQKCFPKIQEGWEAEIKFHILDSTITADVFEQHLKEAGNFIGIGSFRPRNNGYFGRFKVKSIEVM